MRAILMALGFLMMVNSAKAANFVEGYRLLQSETPSVDTVDAYMARHFDNSDFGMSAFLLVTEGWAEGYVGPTYAPVEWVELNLAIGGEQTPDGMGLRYGAGLWLGDGPWSFLASFEANNAVFTGDNVGAWYDLTGTYSVTDWIKIGLRDRRFVGAGPHVVTTIPSTPISLWATWSPVDPEGLAKSDLTRFLLGSALAFP